MYLPAALADKCEQLRAAAYTALLQAHQEAAEAAEAEYPGNPAAMRPDGRTITEARERFAAAELRRRGLPTWVRQVPRGAIARHAIDAWASRTPDQVAAAAVAHAAEHHDQPHRARRDMHDLARSR